MTLSVAIRFSGGGVAAGRFNVERYMVSYNCGGCIRSGHLFTILCGGRWAILFHNETE